jgi:hypothetical protein
MTWRPLRAGLLLLPAILYAPLATAGETGKSPAVVKSDSATFVARAAPDKDWYVLKQGQDVPADELVLGLHDAVLESKNKGVKLRTVTDLSNRSPFPIIETAVRVHPSKDADLDVTLERGRIDVTNVKEKGAAKVVVRFQTRVWKLELEKPGTRFAMEIYGRWPEGSRFNPKPKPEAGPLTSVTLVVLKGELQRSCPQCSVAMSAPPGPAEFGWDSLHGDDMSATKLEQLPDWVKDLSPDAPETKRRIANREKFRTLLLKEGLGEAILFLLDSPDAETRRVGVYALGAFDQMQSLASLLGRSKDFETWNNAVIALRHWLGRGPGHEVQLYNLLLKHDVPQTHARIILQLLMGFTEEERARPELYALLIDLLRHDRLGIRGLAYWHLKRLAPMVKVDYNPVGDKSGWDKARAEYKDKIPDGKLPPSE